MTGPVFVDTNVLVYSRDASEFLKQKRAIAWMKELWTTRRGRLSFQVLQEYYVTVTLKLDPGLKRDVARRDVRTLLSWDPVVVDERVVEGAWEIQDRYQLSWWDSLIVSAARIADCRIILSEDIQADQDMGYVEVVNPFERAPEDIAE